MIDGHAKIINFSDDSRQTVKMGVDILNAAVEVTMGPSGKNVLIERDGAPPILTKDGVTVARAVHLRDRFANMGVHLVREAAQRTAEEAGDGTTTATVLASAIFHEGLKAINAGHELNDIRDGIRDATLQLLHELKAKSTPIKSEKDLLRVANISVNGEEDLAKLIVDALSAVGENGTVTVDEAKGFESSLDVVDGCEVDRGYTSPYFINRPSRMSCELENPAVLITTHRIHLLSHIMHFLEEAANTGRPIVIISPETMGEALQALILNHSKDLINACVLAAPEFGSARIEALKDLSILLGCELLTDEPSAWKNLTLEDLGQCDRLIAYRFRSVFIGAGGTEESRTARINDIISVRDAQSTNIELSVVLDRRLRRMSSGIGILRVGGATESEIRERKDRVDDAIYATRAAIEEGIIPGGGAILARLAAERLKKDPGIGQTILYKAATSPFKQIAKNCGAVPEVVLEKMLEKSSAFGYNGISNEICNLMKAGIMDPVKVTRSALVNASSVAINLLSIGCAMVADEETPEIK